MKKKMYVVKWIIQTLAENPLDAAQEAKDCIVNGGAQVFTVQDTKTKECFSVDLGQEDDEKVAVLPVPLKDHTNNYTKP